MATLSLSITGAKIVGALGTDRTTVGDSAQADVGEAVAVGMSVCVAVGV